jgi:hypothetical protein
MFFAETAMNQVFDVVETQEEALERLQNVKSGGLLKRLFS